MKTCQHCGASIADEAKLCTECGSIQETKKSTAAASSIFAMPYLSAPAAKKTPAPASAPGSDGKDSAAATAHAAAPEKKKIDLSDPYLDPRERAFAKQDRRNQLLRIAAGIVACCVILAGVLYLVLKTSGYEKALDNYIDGRTASSAAKYTAIVPELYLIQMEKTYHITRPDLRSNIDNYFKYLLQKQEGKYGENLHFSYDIISKKVTEDATTCDALESKISKAYGVTLDVDQVASVSIRLVTSGADSTNTETANLTFYQYDSKWYCIEAMDSIQFACENSGYNLW